MTVAQLDLLLRAEVERARGGKVPKQLSMTDWMKEVTE